MKKNVYCERKRNPKLFFLLQLSLFLSKHPMLNNAPDNSKKARKQLTEFEKGQIVAWHESGYTDHEIGKKLNRWCTTIRRFLFKYYLTGSFKRKEGSGRRRKTTAREDRLIIREVRKNRKITAAEIKRNFKLDVDERTVLRRIHSIGKFKSYWSVKKPFISESNRKKRLQWAKQYQNWTIEQWKNVL